MNTALQETRVVTGTGVSSAMSIPPGENPYRSPEPGRDAEPVIRGVRVGTILAGAGLCLLGLLVLLVEVGTALARRRENGGAPTVVGEEIGPAGLALGVAAALAVLVIGVSLAILGLIPTRRPRSTLPAAPRRPARDGRRG